MNAVATTLDTCDVPYVDVLSFRAVPFDVARMIQVSEDMSVREFGAWVRLCQRLVVRGFLPTGFRELARIAKVGLASFERMAGKLAAHFQRDSEGRWTLHDLVRARQGAAAGGEPGASRSPEIEPLRAVKRAMGDQRPVDPELSAKRKVSGTAGAASRWHKTIDLVLGPDEAADDAMANDAAGDGKPGSVGMAKEGVGGGALPSGPPAELASLPSSNEYLNSKLASTAGATAMANQAAPAMANGDLANGVVTNGVVANEVAGPTDAVLIDAVLRTLGDKVNLGDVGRALPVYREAMAAGLDFAKDILPKIAAFGRNKSSVDNPANKHIMADARTHCASRLATEALARPAAAIAPAFADPAIARFAAALQRSLGAEIYASWFTAMTVAAGEPGTLALALPTRFARDWIAQHFEAQAAAALGGTPFDRVRFVVAGEAAQRGSETAQ